MIHFTLWFSLLYASVYPPIFDALDLMELQTGIPLSGLIKLWYLTNSFPQRLQAWNLLQIQPFLILFPLQYINYQKYFSLNIYQADLARPTHQLFSPLCGIQRDLLIHIPPQKVKMLQTTTFIWVHFPLMTRQFLNMKTLLKCFNQVNKLLQCKDTILPIIYFIKYYRGGFGKIWIRKFIYVIFHIFYYSIFTFLDL